MRAGGPAHLIFLDLVTVTSSLLGPSIVLGWALQIRGSCSGPLLPQLHLLVSKHTNSAAASKPHNIRSSGGLASDTSRHCLHAWKLVQRVIDAGPAVSWSFLLSGPST
jgi:hypothetical protein